MNNNQNKNQNKGDERDAGLSLAILFTACIVAFLLIIVAAGTVVILDEQDIIDIEGLIVR